jgi:hypothetical protein
MKYIVDDINDFEVSKYWPIKDRKNLTLTSNASDNRGVGKYTFNEIGLRGDSIYSKRKKILVVGDSNTEGIGLSDEETYGFLLSRLLKCDYINAGMAGRSNDYISRAILNLVKFINPIFVIVVFTQKSRREYATNDGFFEPFQVANKWGYFEDNIELQNSYAKIQNDSEDDINFHKNYSLIRMHLQTEGTPFLWNGSFTGVEYTDDKRFDGSFDILNPIDTTYDELHCGVETNRIYANELFKKIRNKV